MRRKTEIFLSLPVINRERVLQRTFFLLCDCLWKPVMEYPAMRLYLLKGWNTWAQKQIMMHCLFRQTGRYRNCFSSAAAIWGVLVKCENISSHRSAWWIRTAESCTGGHPRKKGHGKNTWIGNRCSSRAAFFASWKTAFLVSDMVYFSASFAAFPNDMVIRIG